MPLFHDRRDGSIKQVPADVVDAYGYASGKDYQDLHEGFISHHMEGYDLMDSASKGAAAYHESARRDTHEDWLARTGENPLAFPFESDEEDTDKDEKEREDFKKNLNPFPSSKEDWDW